MKFLAFLFVMGCQTPVSSGHWYNCESGCMHLGVKEACVSSKGPACTCNDGFTFWVKDEPFDIEAFAIEGEE